MKGDSRLHIGCALSEPEKIRSVFAFLFFETQECVAVTRHSVSIARKGPVIGPGQPVAATDIGELAALLRGEAAGVSALLPENVLGYSGAHRVWFVPPARRPMWVRGDKPLRLDVPWPGLVLAVHEQQLFVAAYRGPGRPGAATPLYHAPLMNIYGDGRVCLGQASIPNGCGEEDMRGWEAVVFETNFTHVNHERTLNLPAGKKGITTPTHIRFWRSLAKTRGGFPAARLGPMNLTLDAWVKGTLKRYGRNHGHLG